MGKEGTSENSGEAISLLSKLEGYGTVLSTDSLGRPRSSSQRSTQPAGVAPPAGIKGPAHSRSESALPKPSPTLFKQNRLGERADSIWLHRNYPSLGGLGKSDN
jgi:hypothetical protein